MSPRAPALCTILPGRPKTRAKSADKSAAAFLQRRRFAAVDDDGSGGVDHDAGWRNGNERRSQQNGSEAMAKHGTPSLLPILRSFYPLPVTVSLALEVG
jgi:hypothetical protein